MSFSLLACGTGRTGADGRPYLGAGLGDCVGAQGLLLACGRGAPIRGTLRPGAGSPTPGEIRSNLAGTVSSGRAVLRDAVAGYVLMAGVDRALSDSLSVGLKVQWKHLGAFDSDAYHGATCCAVTRPT